MRKIKKGTVLRRTIDVHNYLNGPRQQGETRFVEVKLRSWLNPMWLFYGREYYKVL